MKLNQVNALVTGRKGEAEKFITDLHKLCQKEDLFDGFERAYRPLDEENGEKVPSESKKVQHTVLAVLRSAREKWSELWDLVATQDAGNQSASADVVVEGRVVFAQAPVTTLLFLEKQLNDLETFLSKLPTPDPAEDWGTDPNTALLKTRVTQTVRTKKVPRNHVLAEATDRHPAQVQVWHEDVTVGTWNKTRYSGTVSAQTKQQYLARARKLREAVKVAREQANTVDVVKGRPSRGLFDYVLGNTEG